jgi:hypothetical protein
VVLVACQRRTAREGLLTVGVRAFVGSLAGVNATMSRHQNHHTGTIEEAAAETEAQLRQNKDRGRPGEGM